MEEEVHQSDDLILVLSDQCSDWLARVEEALPGCGSDLLGQRGLADQAIEAVLAVPKGAPCSEIGAFDRANDRYFGHVEACKSRPNDQVNRRAATATRLKENTPPASS